MYCRNHSVNVEKIRFKIPIKVILHRRLAQSTKIYHNKYWNIVLEYNSNIRLDIVENNSTVINEQKKIFISIQYQNNFTFVMKLNTMVFVTQLTIDYLWADYPRSSVEPCAYVCV